MVLKKLINVKVISISYSVEVNFLQMVLYRNAISGDKSAFYLCALACGHSTAMSTYM